MSFSMFAMLAGLVSPAAHACPTIATGTKQALTYDVARTAIVRQNGRVTFTVSINPEGQSQDFALVLPVPALLQESDIAVLDGEVFGRLDGYTGLLTMADAGCIQTDYATEDGGGGDGGGDDGGGSGGVTVEAEYLVGDYEVAILSATESDGLFTWLADNGYQLAEPTIPVLEDYIDKCIWGDPATDDFMEFYETEFRPLWADAGFAAWTTEWAGAWGSCSPCSGTNLTEEDLDALGFEGGLEAHFLTRLHVRYTPDTATQDLMLYASGLSEPKVTSFADDNVDNRDCIDVCGMEAEADDSDPGGAAPGEEPGDAAKPAPSEDKSAGCATVTGGGALAVLFGSLLAGLRRRDF
jgi:hypothetical protein